MGESGRRELGDYLKSRRGRITPEQIGLPQSANRRVPGLRREEVAIVAGLSPDHYQRIEQGRSRPSSAALDAIARVLRLTDDERHYLHQLGSDAPARRAPEREDPVPPHLQQLIDASNSPSYLLNHRRDIVAWNGLASALYGDLAAVAPGNRNMAWLVFTDGGFRRLYADWDEIARNVVSVLRYAQGNYPNDDRLAALIERLAVASPEFLGLWREREVAQKCGGYKRLAHPVVGELAMVHQTFAVSGQPGLEMGVYAAADRETAEALQVLGHWSAVDAPTPTWTTAR